MNSQDRLTATRYIWTAFTFAVLFLMGTVFPGGQNLGIAHVFGIGAVALTAFLSTGTVWNWGDLPVVSATQDMSKAKRKSRDKLDKIITRLSDEELFDLRERLVEGDLSDEELHYMLDNDGELIQKR